MLYPPVVASRCFIWFGSDRRHCAIEARQSIPVVHGYPQTQTAFRHIHHIDSKPEHTFNIAPLPGALPEGKRQPELQHEKNLSAQQAAPQTHAWIPCAHGHETRPSGAERPTCQGPGKPLPVVPADAGFPPSVRLKTPAEFNRVFRHGRCSNDAWFRVYARPNRQSARLGMSVARAAVAGAVARNRVKRQIRASFQIRRAELPAVDIVVQAKTAATGASNRELRSSLDWHWQELTKQCAAS